MIHFLNTWVGNKNARMAKVDKTARYTPAQKGDLYAYDWGKGAGLSHLSVEAGFGERSPFYAKDGKGDYINQHSTDRYHAPWNYGYLHPDSSVDPTKMVIYWVSMNDKLGIT